MAQQNAGTSVVEGFLQSRARPTIADPLKIKKDEADKLYRLAESLQGKPGYDNALARAKQFEAEFNQERLKNVAGKTLGDYLSDASRSKWWLINAAQAISGMAGKKIMKSEGYGLGGQLAGGALLTGAMELATGNIDFTNLDEAGRPKGYSTLFPKEVERLDPETGEIITDLDQTKSANPVAELAARYFLNRTGKVLPEDQFLQERPDVTPEEYARFRAAKRENQFFGADELPLTTTAPLGALAGGVAATRMGGSTLKGMAAGAVLGPILKQIAIDVPTQLGVIHGTTETPNDPFGEVEFLGYRIPLKAVITTAVGAAALKYGGRYLKNNPVSSWSDPNAARVAQVQQINLNLDDAVGTVKPDHQYTLDDVIAYGGGGYREPPPMSDAQRKLDWQKLQQDKADARGLEMFEKMSGMGSRQSSDWWQGREY